MGEGTTLAPARTGLAALRVRRTGCQDRLRRGPGRALFGILLAGVVLGATGCVTTASARPSPAGAPTATAGPRAAVIGAPIGLAPGAAQFSLRASADLVALGEPYAPDPVRVDCPVPGRGRWLDARQWVYDFDRPLPGGVRCRFERIDPWRSLAGDALDGARRFELHTGGPAVIATDPPVGMHGIDERQAFVLALDAPVSTPSVLAHAHCAAEGVNETIPLQVIEGDERRAILAGRAVRRWPGEAEPATAIRADRESRRLVVRCARTLPPDAAVDLVWGSGVATPSGEQGHPAVRFGYRTRPLFRARFSCTRTQAGGDCVPVLPMRVDFSAPADRAWLAQVRLRAPDGRVIPGAVDGEAAADEPQPAWWRRWWARILAWFGRAPQTRTAQWLLFRGPFEPNTAYTLELPPGLRDDAGRGLENAERFPLAVRTGEDPPLVRFAARFGVIEAQAGALLPVTVRNLDGAEAAGGARGRMLRLEAPTPRELVAWIRRTEEAWGDGQARREPLLREGAGVRAFELPRSTPARDFEVIGIPLGGPGFYVVELASRRLGAALLESDAARIERQWQEAVGEAKAAGRKPPPRPPEPPARPADAYHVPATALVTNLVAHFKRGRESSLVWVTSLDRGEPVAGARVRVLDCAGTVHHDAVSDRAGLVRIERALPADEALPPCVQRGDRQLVVTVTRGDDFSFTLSGWSEGLAPWRFNLPAGDHDGPYSLRAVLDRTLLRAGETVHMKLFARERVRTGLAVPPLARLAGRVVIEHLGSGRRFEAPVAWQPDGSAVTQWAIPADARLGEYEVRTLDRLAPAGSTGRGADAPGPGGFDEASPGVRARAVARFRVEAFRLPAMRARIAAPAQPLVGSSQTAVDVQVSYLSGGPASGLPVRLRAATSPRVVSFAGHEGFVFANGDVVEGLRVRGMRGGRLDEVDDDGQDADRARTAAPGDGPRPLPARSALLDAQGGARIPIDPIPRATQPQDLLVELEYRDPGGETLTAATRSTWWPSGVVVGLRTDGWVAQRDRLRAEVVVLDPSGRPVADSSVSVDVFRSRDYSHRRRLIGGFYAFESHTDVRRIGSLCSGRTDARGRLACEGAVGTEGNVLLRARASDAQGRPASAHREVWVVGREEAWFDMGDSDRMDVIAEAPRYEPGTRARFQVRMPFREATALVTVEREGVIDARVQTLSGRAPVVEVPVAGSHAPNVFVSVLAVRGRATEVQPTATVDLGRPSLRMGVARIEVGWRAHELQVQVLPERDVLRVRETADVRVRVRRADGSPPPAGAEVALAAVDEALLEIADNDSWPLLARMMGLRGLEVNTATAQLHVVGRRHFGRKALVPGGGGGAGATRELFDTLLSWQPRVRLDAQGEARVRVPLNDSLTRFRIVAVASAGSALFGTGASTVRSTQPLMLISGLPSLVRPGDRYPAQATVRNTTGEPLEARVRARVRDAQHEEAAATAMPEQVVRLAPGEARLLAWPHEVPVARGALHWLFEAEAAGVADRLRIVQRVEPLLVPRPVQATLVQAAPGATVELPVTPPANAEPGSTFLRVSASASMAGDLRAMRDWMAAYPYTCLEQRVSRAVVAGDRAAWDALMAGLPAALDRDGLARYFPTMREGSDVLTAYLLSISARQGWPLPADARRAMLAGLQRFAQGGIARRSDANAADHSLRRVAALAALARQGQALEPAWLESLAVEPQRWPLATLLDWMSVLDAVPARRRDAWREEAASVLRARVVLQGTTLGLVREPSERMGWLLGSPDASAARLLLAAVDDPAWQDDLARLARGLLDRQREGRWDTTVANAWASVALARFAARREAAAVGGSTRLEFAGEPRALAWAPSAGRPGDSAAERFDVPPTGGTLRVSHVGAGQPWITVQTHAALRLREPVAAGFRLERTLSAVVQREPGRWSVGDQVRVRLSIEAQTPMSWVVVADPVPAGAALLAGASPVVAAAAAGGSTQGARPPGPLAPDFEERAAAAYRAYFRQVPQGRFVVEYVMRLNQAGRFGLPSSRVEAMYAPDMYGELPASTLEVAP